MQFANFLFYSYRSLIGSNFVIFYLSQPSEIHIPPNQTDLCFKGSVALIGRNLKEAVSGLMNITCYYNQVNVDNNTNKINSKYYLLAVDFIDKDGHIINEKQILTNELSSNSTMRNDYVASLSKNEKAEIYDVRMGL